jgi:hypothetical protein
MQNTNNNVYNELWQRLQGKHSAIDFYEFDDLHYQLYGHMHPLCYYKQLLMKKSFKIPLDDQKTADLKKLTTKYGKTDITYLIPLDQMPEELAQRGVTNLLKIINDDIGNAHKDKVPAVTEIYAQLNNNLEFAYNNQDNLAYIDSKIFESICQFDLLFEEWQFKLDEKTSILLTQVAFIHILTGHTPFFKIPRKGLLAQFTDTESWLDILYLLDDLIKHLKQDILTSFKIHKRYDNKCISFNGKQYGLHIQKNKTISSFYPVATYNS